MRTPKKIINNIMKDNCSKNKILNAGLQKKCSKCGNPYTWIPNASGDRKEAQWLDICNKCYK